MKNLESDERSQGWEAVTCKNHPNLRWTRKDRRITGRISNNPQLMFDGDKDHPERKVHPFVTSIPELLKGFTGNQDTLIEYLQKFAFECLCPGSDLVSIYPKEEFHSRSEMRRITAQREARKEALDNPPAKD